MQWMRAIVRSCRRALAASSHTGTLVLQFIYEPEFDPAQLESRHDALDSPSMLCIRVPSPLAWGRNSSVRELCAQRRHVLGDGGGGSILTASPFSSAAVLLLSTVVPGMWHSR